MSCVYKTLSYSFFLSPPPSSLPPLLSLSLSLGTNSPAILRAEHQEQVLELMTRSHLVLLDDLCQIFQLQSANTDCQIDLVQNLMAADKRKEVHTCTCLALLLSSFLLRFCTYNIYIVHERSLLCVWQILVQVSVLLLTTQAVTYAWTFNIQAHFDIAEMLLPLIAMDKINLIERCG